MFLHIPAREARRKLLGYFILKTLIKPYVFDIPAREARRNFFRVFYDKTPYKTLCFLYNPGTTHGNSQEIMAERPNPRTTHGDAQQILGPRAGGAPDCFSFSSFANRGR